MPCTRVDSLTHFLPASGRRPREGLGAALGPEPLQRCGAFFLHNFEFDEAHRYELGPEIGALSRRRKAAAEEGRSLTNYLERLIERGAEKKKRR